MNTKTKTPTKNHLTLTTATEGKPSFLPVQDAYHQFLLSKIRFAENAGFEVDESEVNPILKPHQKAIVRWAVQGGRRAIFAAFGLGKTFMQIETLRLISQCIERNAVPGTAAALALITCPLGVRQEFIQGGKKMGNSIPFKRTARQAFTKEGKTLGVDFAFIRTNTELDRAVAEGFRFFLTNYESIRDGKLTPSRFAIASLDEASVLRSYGSKTYQEFLPLFENVRYRFVCTATPSPNKFKELIHYAGFLGIMDTGQALTRFFQRDSTKANNLTLYPHKEKEFWFWLHSWAIFLQKPSDLGFSDEGYELPPLKVIFHEIASDAPDEHDKRGQGFLFRDASLGLSQAASEKRESLPHRIGKMREILDAAPNDHFLIWHNLEKERLAIAAAVPTAKSVYGTQDLDDREQAVMDFGDGKYQYLSTKPELCGSGCNFQRFCHKAVFLGIGYKFNDFIQAVHRIYRFLQTEQCEIHIIHTEAEREILRALMTKWEQHKTMTENMTAVIREHGLNRLSMQDALARTIGVERIEVKGKRGLFRVANNDCVLEARLMPDNSVDLVHTSIPFSNHYEYTPSYNDFGHNEDNARFFEQMDYLTPELLRILKPGRIAAIHVKDRIEFGNTTGYGAPSVDPFHAECIHHYRKHGFIFVGMVTVVTDVVRENNQTYRLGWTENSKDGTKMGVGCPEYVLLFRKLQTDRTKGYADTPVIKSKEDYNRARWQVDAHAFWRSSGDRLLSAEEMATYGPDKLAKLYTQYSLQNVYDYEFHVKLGTDLDTRGALPSSFMSLAPGSHSPDVWTDINRMRTLNGNQTNKGLQNHVCPLQFDIVDRIITRFSNPSELVYDPFAGLMTVPMRAVALGRKGAGSELNTSYFFDGVHYLEAAEQEVTMPSLFSFEELDGAKEDEEDTNIYLPTPAPELARAA